MIGWDSVQPYSARDIGPLEGQFDASYLTFPIPGIREHYPGAHDILTMDRFLSRVNGLLSKVNDGQLKFISLG